MFFFCVDVLEMLKTCCVVAAAQVQKSTCQFVFVGLATGAIVGIVLAVLAFVFGIYLIVRYFAVGLRHGCYKLCLRCKQGFQNPNTDSSSDQPV